MQGINIQVVWPHGREERYEEEEGAANVAPFFYSIVSDDLRGSGLLEGEGWGIMIVLVL